MMMISLQIQYEYECNTMTYLMARRCRVSRFIVVIALSSLLLLLQYNAHRGIQHHAVFEGQARAVAVVGVVVMDALDVTASASSVAAAECEHCYWIVLVAAAAAVGRSMEASPPA